MNNCNFIGRAAADAEVRYAASGMAVTTFRIAVDSGYGEKKHTNWIPVTCFGKTAEFVGDRLKKGKRCAVTGEYTTGSYRNKSGETVYTTEITASRVEIIDYAENTAAPETFDSLPEGFEVVDEPPF